MGPHKPCMTMDSPMCSLVLPTHPADTNHLPSQHMLIINMSRGDEGLTQPICSGGTGGTWCLASEPADGFKPSTVVPVALQEPRWAGCVPQGSVWCGAVRGVLPVRCLPHCHGRSCDRRARGGSSTVSHGEGEGEQLPGSDNAAGGGRPGSCARVLPQQEPSATKPSSAFPISHSGLTFQQLPLRAGFTSSQ